MRARQGYNLDGALVSIDGRRDDTLSVFVEHGLTPKLTLQAKAGLAQGEDSRVDYSGRGPLELGLRWTARRTDRSSLALYLGAAEPGEGRNAGYAAPGQGTLDLEARVFYGRSGVWRGRKVYVDLQAARVQRQGLADENRFDASLGLKLNDHWEVLTQTNAGRTDDPTVRARWLKTELSVVRAFGDWSLQAGWRDTVAGRETARDRGVVLALWRRM